MDGNEKIQELYGYLKLNTAKVVEVLNKSPYEIFWESYVAPKSDVGLENQQLLGVDETLGNDEF